MKKHDNIQNNDQIKFYVTKGRQKILKLLIYACIFGPDIAGNRQYGVIRVELQTSGTSGPTTGAIGQGQGAMSGGNITAIIFSILGLLTIILLGMYCLIDRRRPRSRYVCTIQQQTSY